MDIDNEYTAADHSFREDDDYARAKYDITLRWLAPRKLPAGAVIYNIGCGNGLFNELASNRGYHIRAFEPHRSSFEIAASNPPENCSVEPLGIFEIEGENIADAVVMHDVLEHIENDSGAIDKLHQLLKPGGILVLSVPAMQSLFGLHDEQLGHYCRYSKKRLRQAFSAKFEIETLRYFGMSFIPVTAWYSRFRRKPYPTATASGPSFIGSAFRKFCEIESRIPTPIGTSLVLRARPVK